MISAKVVSTFAASGNGGLGKRGADTNRRARRLNAEMPAENRFVFNGLYVVEYAIGGNVKGTIPRADRTSYHRIMVRKGRSRI